LQQIGRMFELQAAGKGPELFGMSSTAASPRSSAPTKKRMRQVLINVLGQTPVKFTSVGQVVFRMSYARARMAVFEIERHGAGPLPRTRSSRSSSRLRAAQRG